MITENYLDPDVAYLLGLITIRGELHENPGDNRIIIHFPFKSLIAEGIRTRVAQENELMLGVNRIRDRLQELVEGPIEVDRGEHEVIFRMRFLRNTLVWRNTRLMFGAANSFREFQIPDSVTSSPSRTTKVEFLRGVADAAGFVRKSNHYYDRHRVYLEVNNQNWRLPIQLCRMMQVDLDVPVQLIQWGHPNVRQPNVFTGRSWAKEHQVKVYVEAFSRIGFYVPYKDQILGELVEANEAHGWPRAAKCNPNPEIRRPREKPAHPGEDDPGIPNAVRRHFDGYWQICVALGCEQCVPAPQRSMKWDEEEDNE